MSTAAIKSVPAKPANETSLSQLKRSSQMERLEFWKSFFESGSAVLGCFAAVMLVIALILSNRLGKLERAEAAEKESEASAHIANANARAEEAQKTAKSFEGEIAKANERAAAAQTETAKFNEIAERERLARIQLEEKLTPRWLLDGQRTSLIEKLKPFAGVTADIVLISNESEIVNLSRQISSILTDSGWKVRGTWTSMGGLSGQGIGVCIAKDSEDSVANAAAAFVNGILSTMKQVGPMPPFEGDDPPGGAVMGPPWAKPSRIRIFVGEKP
jgi:hypothetical protein